MPFADHRAEDTERGLWSVRSLAPHWVHIAACAGWQAHTPARARVLSFFLPACLHPIEDLQGTRIVLNRTLKPLGRFGWTDYRRARDFHIAREALQPLLPRLYRQCYLFDTHREPWDRMAYLKTYRALLLALIEPWRTGATESPTALHSASGPERPGS